MIPEISSLTPVTTAVPLIGVLALTAIKDAYDDIVSYCIFAICAFVLPQNDGFLRYASIWPDENSRGIRESYAASASILLRHKSTYNHNYVSGAGSLPGGAVAVQIKKLCAVFHVISDGK